MDGISEWMNGTGSGPAGSGDANVMTEMTAVAGKTEISGEYALPDYMPDMAKVLSVRGRIGKSGIGSEEKMKWSGDIGYSLLYLDPGGALTGFDFSDTFSGSEDTSVPENSAAYGDFRIGNVTVRPLSARKIGIRAEIMSEVNVFTEKSPATVTETGEPVSEGFEVLTEEAETAEVRADESEEMTVSEDIELDGSMPTVRELISSSVSFLPPDLHIRDGEMTVETELCFDGVYEAEDGGYFPIHKRMHVGQSVPSEGINAESQLLGEVIPGEVKTSVQSNSYGERRIIELDLPCRVKVLACRNRPVPVIKDVYSTQTETQTGMGLIEPVTFLRTYSPSVSVNASVPRSEAGLENAGTVFDGCVTVGNVKTTCDPEKHRIVIEAEATVSLITDDASENGGYLSGTFTYPVQCETDSGPLPAGVKLICRTSVETPRFRLDSNAVYADFEVGFRIMAFEIGNCKYVSTVRTDPAHPLEKRTAPMTLYYPDAGETDWEIAKKYHVTRSALEAANAPSDSRRVVLIPREAQNASENQPVFSGII